MKRYARIENEVIREVIEISDDFNILEMFHPSLNWQPAPAGCQEGWLVHEGEIVAPDNYKILRSKEYPSIFEFIDGMVKEHSPDPTISTKGTNQLTSYYTAALAVKTKYPKPGP